MLSAEKGAARPRAGQGGLPRQEAQQLWAPQPWAGKEIREVLQVSAEKQPGVLPKAQGQGQSPAAQQQGPVREPSLVAQLKLVPRVVPVR